MAEKVDQPTGEQPPAKSANAEAKKPAKKAKQPKQPKQPKQEDGVYLPMLVEFTYATSMIFLILVFLAMAVVSWLTGTSLLDFVLRTSAAMGVLGSLMLIVTRQVSTDVLSINIAEMEEKQREEISELVASTENPVQIEKPEIAESVGIPLDVEAQ